MKEYMGIINNLIYFVIFVVSLLFLISIIFNIYFKKFNLKKNRLYGILIQQDNRQILAMSLVTLNYLFLVWSIMTTSEMNFLYGSMIVTSSILSSILLKDFLKLPINILISVINCFAIYIVHFVHNYLIGEVSDIYMRISIFFIIAFSFIYFTYIYINDINDIIKKNKYIKKKSKVK